MIVKTSMVCMAAILAAAAHSGKHTHGGAPHGGLIEDAGKYHYELVVKQDVVDVYVYNGKMKPVALEAKVNGTILVTYPGTQEKQNKSPLTVRMQGTHASATVLGISTTRKFIAVVTLKLEGKTVSGRFSHTPKENEKTAKSSPAAS